MKIPAALSNLTSHDLREISAGGKRTMTLEDMKAIVRYAAAVEIAAREEENDETAGRIVTFEDQAERIKKLDETIKEQDEVITGLNEEIASLKAIDPNAIQL
jgi:DNA polymerase elongation subunit (family B)